MDHSHHNMDHPGMDHGHGDMDMDAKCAMNMLFTWSTKNLCIIFSGWHVQGAYSLIGSLLLVILLTAGYEAVRAFTRRYEAMHQQRLKAYTSPVPVDDEIGPSDYNTRSSPEPANAVHSLVVGRDSKIALERRGKIFLALLYAVQVFYSFFLMLLFMTYNGWIMLSVAVGAFVGYLAFGHDATAAKSAACH
ncbi:hypothetical protein VTN31DRAFT_4667 [Thermomyces dupontii]|uniref:uncharacterized protein n=1 Tax=Talaromyces thermophilus TaxID=28565 RepID=UPI00374212F7